MLGKTVGVIDLGTNTALMLIGRKKANGKIQVLTDEHAVVGLGQGVDSTGKLNIDAIDRACKQLEIYAKKASNWDVMHLTAWGTSALRDATNKEDLINRVYQTSGITLRVMSATDEAEYTYWGAIDGLAKTKNISVIDIGGGSTEVATGTKQKLLTKKSVNIGALRLSERYSLNKKNNKTKINDTYSDIVDEISCLSLHDKNTQLIAVSGTALTIAAIESGKTQILHPVLHGRYIKTSFVRHCYEQYAHKTSDQLSKIPAIGPNRSKIISAGILILYAFLTKNDIDGFTASARGVRYGVLNNLISSA